MQPTRHRGRTPIRHSRHRIRPYLTPTADCCSIWAGLFLELVLALWYMHTFAWFLLDDSGFAAGYDYWDAVIVYTVVYYSKYYVLLWFTIVNTTFYYGLLWWISQFTIFYYSKYHTLLRVITVNTIFLYGLLWWIPQFTIVNRPAMLYCGLLQWIPCFYYGLLQWMSCFTMVYYS